MPTAPNISVRVTRQFAAPPERVFDAWLDSALVGQWMFGPRLRDEEVLRIAVDAQIGGSFSFLVRRQGQEIDHVGQYQEIDRPRRLAFTWGVGGHSQDESRIILDIAPHDSGCELTLTHAMQPQWANYAERTQEAWTKMLAALADVLA